MIGIYKITSPNNRIYIGQSKRIEIRFKEYKNINNTKSIPRLHNSFLKYGINTHTFEIIENCSLEDLNIRERYWQDFYDVLNGGLNCQLTTTENCPAILSEEYKAKISKTLLFKYKNGTILQPKKDTGVKYSIYNMYGDLLIKDIPILQVLTYVNLTNTSTINISMRKNKFIINKKFIVIPENKSFSDYIQSIIDCDGDYIKLYSIDKYKTIKQYQKNKARILEKVLKTDDLLYYSKKSECYITFIGLINKCPFI